MSLSAVLFDLDGTLIDSNESHVATWYSALETHGYRVARDRIRVEVGKGGDHLLPDLIGTTAYEADGAAIEETQKRDYAAIIRERPLRVFEHATSLVAALRARGLKVALATSSSDAQIDVAEHASGVAWRALFDEVVRAEDVTASKPSADVVSAAVEKLGLTPAQCAMIGDTPWDAWSARKAGVVALGVGSDGRRLKRAGARRVYADVGAIFAKLDDVLRIAAPGSASLDRTLIESLVRASIVEAKVGLMNGEVPIGSVLARGDGTIIGRGHNRYNATKDCARHAELDAFANAGHALEPSSRDAILVSSLEPCVMCTGAAMETACDVILYALSAPADSGTLRVTPPESPENQLPRIVGPILGEESRALFEEWIRRGDRNREQEPYVRQLLART